MAAVLIDPLLRQLVRRSLDRALCSPDRRLGPSQGLFEPVHFGLFGSLALLLFLEEERRGGTVGAALGVVDRLRAGWAGRTGLGGQAGLAGVEAVGMPQSRIRRRPAVRARAKMPRSSGVGEAARTGKIN